MKLSLSTLVLAGAATFVLLGGAPAKADLTFSFTVTNTQGDVPGTFTGEIFGLTNNTTSAATHVVIDSFPSGLNSLVSPPIDATTWDQQYQNSFTVSNDQITDGGFWAQQTINGIGQGYQLYLNGEDGFNFLNLDGTNFNYVWGDDGFAAANFTLVSSTVPEPGSLAMFLGLGLTGVGFLRRRRRA
jgi:hypothetical protein